MDNIKMVILKSIFKKWNWSMCCIDLAYDRYVRRAVVNTAMNLRFPHYTGNFLTEEMLAS